MSFQTIFNIQQSMGVNNRRMIGQQYSRSGQITVAQYLTTVPWVFTVKPHDFLYYPQVRDVIQSIDNADRQIPEYISFSNDNLSWFTVMQGTATAANLNGTPTTNSQTITINSNGTFEAGDFVQIGGYVYKVTEYSLGGTIKINRPLIGTPSSGEALKLGNDVEFYVVAEKCPTYILTPMSDGAFVNWSGEFVFKEYITG
jgi:hypothetical protein